MHMKGGSHVGGDALLYEEGECMNGWYFSVVVVLINIVSSV